MLLGSIEFADGLANSAGGAAVTTSSLAGSVCVVVSDDLSLRKGYGKCEGYGGSGIVIIIIIESK